jgi:hypothetical protein
MHNIRLFLQIPPQYAKEVYYERLSHIPESKTKEKAKKLSTKIDNYKIDIFFYPTENRKTVIYTSCSDKPFPISLNTPQRVTSDFTSFVAQIHHFICSHISDYRGKIIGPIHNTQYWTTGRFEYNWDIPTTTLQFLGMDGIQVTGVDDVIKRVYRKRFSDNGKRCIRLEESVDLAALLGKKRSELPIDDTIGFSLVEAAKAVKKRLSMGAATAAEEKR